VKSKEEMMTTEAGEALIRRYAAASAVDDFAAMEELRHPDWQEAWPQSGEVVTSSANYRAARTAHPEGSPQVRPGRLGGSGDCWWGEAVIDYADGSRWLGITIFELRDGLIFRERLYFGPPFPALEWRAEWVEREEPAVS
jgi:hypothetical protein